MVTTTRRNDFENIVSRNLLSLPGAPAAAGDGHGLGQGVHVHHVGRHLLDARLVALKASAVLGAQLLVPLQHVLLGDVLLPEQVLLPDVHLVTVSKLGEAGQHLLHHVLHVVQVPEPVRTLRGRIWVHGKS